ncbi:sterol desaturase family protein [Fusibacter sp. JL216-2]|uniref:sterol desaturase family protein n=1 Tax=Fusibacter sp. JL216-2 TaxID=3071453 RepID=UPI003D32916F
MLGQIIGMVLGFMASSLIEYMLHKEYLHRNDNMHHITLHHKNYYGDSRFSKPGSAWSDIASSPAYIITNILMYLPLSVLSYFVSRPFGSAFTITAIAYTLWVEIAHFWYHSPLNSSIEKKEVFKKIKEHHKIHHVHYNKNYGIGSSFWDYIFKTKKEKMTL